MPPLHPYQNEGASWLASRRLALLADEMGLGKTAQAITAADYIQADSILVLCPAIARHNWLREFEKFSWNTRKFQIVESRKLGTTLPQFPNLICSYDLAASLPRDLKFDVLILDESHFLKNPEAARTRAVFSTGGLVHRSHRVWCLTGTPMPNHAGELWLLLYLFGQTPLKYPQFVQTFCQTYDSPYSHRGITIAGTKSHMIPELKKLLAPIMLRRKKDEVMIQLPPIIFSDVLVERSPVDIEMHASFAQYLWPVDKREELKQRLEKELKMLTTLTDDLLPNKKDPTMGTLQVLEGLSESVSTLRRYIGLLKLPRIAQMVNEELEANAYQKIVIFAIHADVIEGLRAKLAKFNAVTLYGQTDPKTRVRNLHRFEHDPNTRLIICNIKAAGTAINLTAAHQVLFAEASWTPGDNAQAACRCHRIGQSKPVNVRFVGLLDSIDEKVMSVLKRKAQSIAELFDDTTRETQNRQAKVYAEDGYTNTPSSYRKRQERIKNEPDYIKRVHKDRTKKNIANS